MALGQKTDPTVWLERLAMAVLLLVPIWVPGPFPTYDGPQHTFQGYLLNHLHDPGTVFARYLDIQIPFSAMFAPVLTAFFEHFLPLRVAVKCVLSVVSLLQLGGFLWILEGLGVGRSPFRWPAVFLPYGFIFYMGFENYTAAFGFGLLALGKLLSILRQDRSGERQGLASWWKLGVLLLLAALSHAFATAVVGVAMGLLLIGACPRARLPANLGKLLLASLPTLVLMAMVATSASAHQRDPFWTQLGLHWSALTWLPRDLYETPYGIVWTANALLGLGLVLLVWGTIRGRRLAGAVLLALAGLALMLLLVPERVDAWEGVPIRFAPYVGALALAGGAVQAAATPRLRPILSGVVLVFSLVSLGLITRANLELAGLQEEFEAGIGQVEEPGVRRAYVRNGSPDPAHPDSYMAANLHVYYMVEEGAVFPFIFRNRPEAHFLRQTAHWEELEPPGVPSLFRLPDPVRWQVQARMGLYFDEVLLWDPRVGELDAFAVLGFRVLFSHKRLFRLRPVHRGLRLRVLLDRPRRIYATAVFGDLLWPYRTCILVPMDGQPEQLQCDMAGLPASLVWISVFERTGGDEDPRLRSLSVDLSAGDQSLFIDLHANDQPAD